MKKRIMLVCLLLAAVLLLSACGEKKEAAPLAETTGSVPTVINNAEYVLYQNIFKNNYASQYEGKSVTKRGVFATVQDGYNDITRYYVWGVLDQTKCCDWQWELNVADASSLPANGSLVDVTGIFRANDTALDKYWIDEAQVTTVSRYTGPTAEVDMLTMSGTLQYVQLASVNVFPDKFEGKTATAYGRIYDPNNIQDPYYDGSWTTGFSSDAELPAIGTSVKLRGVIAGSVISNASIEITQ